MTDSVDTRYVRKVIAEWERDKNYKMIRLFLEGMVCKGKRMFWKRGVL